VLLGLCDHYGSQQQSVEIERDHDTRIFKAVLADVRAGYGLVPWALNSEGWAENIQLRLLIEEELS